MQLYIIDGATDRYYYARASETNVELANLGRVKAFFR